MSVISVDKDMDRLTMTVVAEYDVTAERAWQLWSDPRQLERWWGPPTYPATFEQHDLTPGAIVLYCMTGPEGDKAPGWWRILESEAPRRLIVEDGFGVHPDQAPAELPVMLMRMHIEDRDGGGVRMTLVTTFPSRAGFDQVLAMGMEEGLTLAMGQIDEVLAH